MQQQSELERQAQDLEYALRQADSANRAKSVFLKTVSHELRTPLNAIIGFSSLLLDGSIVPPAEEQRKPLSIILRSGQELLNVIREILDTSSHETGKLTVVDRERLGQVVRNLLSNALIHTDHGFVEVRASRAVGLVNVEVEDTGVGIPADQQSLLFQPFHRVTGQSRPLRPGIGLGLTISRRIVEAMGGTFGFESEEGRGSRFWFTVPAASQA